MGQRPTVWTSDPSDLSHPAADASRVRDAARPGARGLGPERPEALRFGWASAVLEAHPELLLPWADSPERPVRRAVMRAPGLTADAAELVVASRRTGMHTLGANPAAPRELLADNPSAMARRDRIERVEPGGLPAVSARPNREALVDLASGTIDLVLARSPALDQGHAVLLAGRTGRPVDPWVAAVLVERFGEPVWTALLTHASRERVAATAALSEVGARLRR